MHRRTFLATTLALGAALSSPARAEPLAPFKLYDTHAHFYSGDLARYPLRPDIAAAARARVLEAPITPQTLFPQWDDAGVERGCGVQYNTTYFTDNRYLLDVARQHPDRVSAVVILDPLDPATPAALRAMAKAYGVSGVRFAGMPADDGSFDFLSDAAAQAWRTAEELQLVVVLMPRRSPQPRALPDAMRRIGELAERYPNVTIVLDHIGYPVAERTPVFGFSPEHLALAGRPNIYYKHTSFLMEIMSREGGAPARDFLNYAVGVFGAERFLWGSDVGNSPGALRHLVALALDAAQDLTPAQKQAMFYDNAMALFVPGGRALARAGGGRD